MHRNMMNQTLGIFNEIKRRQNISFSIYDWKSPISVELLINEQINKSSSK